MHDQPLPNQPRPHPNLGQEIRHIRSRVYDLDNGNIAVFDAETTITKAKSFWFKALSYDDLHDHNGRRMKN